MSLFLIREILKNMNGTISISSKLNVGSSFKVEFPNLSIHNFDIRDEILSSRSIMISSIYEEEKISFCKSPNQLLSIKNLSQESNLLNCISKCQCPKILIVDDEVSNRNVLCSFCRKAKILFEEASNGDEACVKIYSFSSRFNCCKTYRLIFMDSNMPVMNGEDASLNIRKFYHKIRVSPPQIYCVTANSDQNDVIKQRNEFIYDKILNKPLTHDVFKKEIMQFCDT